MTSPEESVENNISLMVSAYMWTFDVACHRLICDHSETKRGKDPSVFLISSLPKMLIGILRCLIMSNLRIWSGIVMLMILLCWIPTLPSMATIGITLPTRGTIMMMTGQSLSVLTPLIGSLFMNTMCILIHLKSYHWNSTLTPWPTAVSLMS